jgi:hypothetical protein
MSSTARPARVEPGALPKETCLARLGRSRAGYLACSARALPTVVPVTVHVVAGQLLLDLPDARMTEQLVGQVVALGVGRPRRAWRTGWTVVARGPLSDVPGNPTELVLDPQQLEGRTLGRVDEA